MNDLSSLDPKQADLLVLTQVRKNLGDSHQLQKLGIKISVQVNRLPDSVGRKLNANIEGVKAEKIKELTIDEAKPFYQLRAEHEKDAESCATQPPEAITSFTGYDDAIRKNYIYPKGGYTKVELVHPVSGKTYTGECHFGIHTVFNRKQANRRAFGKMFSKMLADCLLGRKRGKQVINGLVQ